MRIIPLVGVVVLACTSGRPSASGPPDQHACRKLASTYFRKPLRQKIDEFTSHTLVEQYNIYICGNQYMHPAAQYLAAPFASEGAPAAVFLKKRLAEARDDLTIRDIVMVFAEMKRQHSYDVAGDDQLMSLIRQKAKIIVEPFWHRYVANAVAEIERR